MEHRGGTVRTRPAMVGVVVCCALLAACAGTAPRSDAGPAVVPVGLERFYAQTLDWGPCTGFAMTEEERAEYREPSFECARLDVPLDYAAPAGRLASIAVMRVRTTSAERIGSLVLNPGGPGGSGLAFVADWAGERLGGGPFDVVGFDPRGVGASTPQLSCATPEERDAERADTDMDPSPAGVAQTEAESRRYAERCIELSGGLDVLANAGTRDVVRDLDVLRAVLGDRALTYAGFSYGTRIGALYAEAFPGNVRAMVLDGAVDPAQSAADSSLAQTAGFQRAFDAFAAECAAWPSCPLGADPAAATAAFQRLTRPLITTPVGVGTRTLTYSDAVSAVIGSMYSSTDWPRLADALAALVAGDGAPLLQIADEWEDYANGGYERPDGPLQVVNCLDGDLITDRAVIADVAVKELAAAPFADPGSGPVAALGACAFLPVTPTNTPHELRVDGLPPTLVVSTTGDAATPYDDGVALAAALKGALLTVEADQHTAFLTNACVDEIVVRYLADLELPAAGARCER
ncbi:alpha/beta fold hydrolase [Actinomycetes bacterium KLBMP 9759]